MRQKSIKLNDGQESCEMLTSEHGIALALINSQQLWLLVQYLYETMPVKVPAQTEKELLKPFPYWSAIDI